MSQSLFIQMHNRTRSLEGSFNQGLQDLFYKADDYNRRRLIAAFPDFFGEEVPEFGIYKQTPDTNELVDELRSRLKAYRETERKLITTKSSLYESDVENYTDSYKWLRDPLGDGRPGIEVGECLSYFESFPNNFLSEILRGVLKNRVHKGIRVEGLSIDRVGTDFGFCISGSTSLEEIRSICTQRQPRRDHADEK